MHYGRKGQREDDKKKENRDRKSMMGKGEKKRRITEDGDLEKDNKGE